MSDMVLLNILWYTILILFGVVGFYYEVIRYRQAMNLHSAVLNACTVYYNKHPLEFEGFCELYELPSVNSMVYSFKPIRAKTFLNEESYKKLKKYIAE